MTYLHVEKIYINDSEFYFYSYIGCTLPMYMWKASDVGNRLPEVELFHHLIDVVRLDEDDEHQQ
jgi:hypothetical protein